jgi:hypothetical protein
MGNDLGWELMALVADGLAHARPSTPFDPTSG